MRPCSEAAAAIGIRRSDEKIISLDTHAQPQTYLTEVVAGE